MMPSHQKLIKQAVIVIDDEGSIVHLTDEAARIVGWNAGDLLSQRLMDDLSTEKSLLEVTGRGGTPVRMKPYAACDGQGWLLLPLGDEHLRPLTGDALLSGSELTYRAFFEQAPIGIVHLDASGHVTFENHVLRQIFGERPEEAWIGRSVFSIEALDDFLLPLVQRMLTQGRSFDAPESRFAGAPGFTHWLRVAGTPIRDVDGAVAGGVVTIQDVTEVKMAEAVMERARREAEAASLMKTELIATISHELRTPVGTIRGYAGMLSDELSEGEASNVRIVEFANVIRERATDLESLVSDLVEFAHLEAGLITPQIQETSLTSLVNHAVERALSRYDNPVEILVEVGDEITCSADPARLSSVVDRILDNALKFTPQGYVRITASRCGEMVQLQVADTGIGMAVEYVERIFDPFAQEEPTMNRRFEGAGLGLAVSRRVVEMMGGNISVESSPGEGTCITLEFPMKGSRQPSD